MAEDFQSKSEAIWGISSTTNTPANLWNLPKWLLDSDANWNPRNCFSVNTGWLYRHYKDNVHSGLSSDYYDEVLVDVSDLSVGLGTGSITNIFFELPNAQYVRSGAVGYAATTGISTGSTGYVNVCFNKLVYAGAGSTITLNGGTIVATASSAPGLDSSNTGISGAAAQLTYINNDGSSSEAGVTPRYDLGYNGQITNRVSFAFTAPTTAGTDLFIDLSSLAGIFTDVNGAAVNASTNIYNLRNVGGSGGPNNEPVGYGGTFAGPDPLNAPTQWNRWPAQDTLVGGTNTAGFAGLGVTFLTTI